MYQAVYGGEKEEKSDSRAANVVENAEETPAGIQVQESDLTGQLPEHVQVPDVTGDTEPLPPEMVLRRRIRLPDDEEGQASLNQIDVLCPFREPGDNWKGGCRWVGSRQGAKKHLAEECAGIMGKSSNLQLLSHDQQPRLFASTTDPNTGQKAIDVPSLIIIGMDDKDSDYEEDDNSNPDHTAIQIDEDGRIIALLSGVREPQPMSGGFMIEDAEARPMQSTWKRWLCVMFGFALLGGFIAYLIAGNAGDAQGNAKNNTNPANLMG